MRTLIVIFAIPIIIIVPHYLIYLNAEPSEVIERSDEIEGLLDQVELFLNFMVSVWVALSGMIAFLAARYTFLRENLNRATRYEFYSLSLLPAIGFCCAFLFKSPGFIAISLHHVVDDKAVYLLSGLVMFSCLLLHLTTKLASRWNRGI